MGNTTSVFLRGMDSKRILVLIDGVRFQDPSNTSGAAFEHLMINEKEKIEVVKGVSNMGYTAITFVQDIPANAQIVIRFWYSKFFKKYIRHIVVIMLSSMY